MLREKKRQGAGGKPGGEGEISEGGGVKCKPLFLLMSAPPDSSSRYHAELTCKYDVFINQIFVEIKSWTIMKAKTA